MSLGGSRCKWDFKPSGFVLLGRFLGFLQALANLKKALHRSQFATFGCEALLQWGSVFSNAYTWFVYHNVIMVRSQAAAVGQNGIPRAQERASRSFGLGLRMQGPSYLERRASAMLRRPLGVRVHSKT